MSGEDAERFLQAQLSCNLLDLPVSTGRPFAWCTPAGRVRISGWVLRAEQRFFLLLGSGLAVKVAQTLGRYIMRDRVRIEASLYFLIENSAGAKDAACLEIDLPGNALRGLGISTEANSAVNAQRFMLADIRAGVCVLPAALEERFIPQMLNLDLNQGVSFTKGCYPGQEIVARTHNLGRVKRRMLRLTADVQPPPAATPVYCGEKEVGQSLIAAPGERGTELLAVLNIESLAGHALALGSPAGAILRPLSLPYDIPEISADDRD